MTLPNLPEVPQKATLEQLTQIVAEMSQQLTYLLSGFLSSNNAREFGGWQIGSTELQSKTKTVGMSTEITGADDIRFWAGDLKGASPKFKVTEAGVTSLVSAIISSVSSGERVVIDSTGIHCYDASNVERMTVGTTTTKGTKAITFKNTSGVESALMTYGTETVDFASRTGLYIVGPGGSGPSIILFEDDGTIRIEGDSGDGFKIESGGYPQMRDSGVGAWKVIAKNEDLALKANAFTGVNGTVYVASSSGGPTTTAITFTNGVRTS